MAMIPRRTPLAPADSTSIAHRARLALGVFGVWLAFNGLQIAVNAALTRPAPIPCHRELPVDLTMAVYWTIATGVIAVWHRRLRSRGATGLRLLAAHLPLVALTAIGDMYSTRLSLRVFGGVTPPLPFVAALTYYADFDAISYLAIVAVVDALIARDALRVGERRAARLEGLPAREPCSSRTAQSCASHGLIASDCMAGCWGWGFGTRD